jgi:hypothetical protein
MDAGCSVLVELVGSGVVAGDLSRRELPAGRASSRAGSHCAEQQESIPGEARDGLVQPVA